MNIRPLHDRVIVRRLEAEHKTAGGIVIPETAAEMPDQGKVLAIGPGKRLGDGRVSAPSVKIGERVLFGKYTDTTVKLAGEHVLVMHDEDILCVVG